ncbi:MAG: adenosylmethionine--8-amino-7-oxononanoate transaminase [Desulfobulbaceae bacterium]|jgi:adenosylmethionine-8-amino-7-oxononanoate aminotransferase|nr:adenosylmethionine--8-amino-7-oxononanoate transaminase [Desulfobulbaceae bacterium]
MDTPPSADRLIEEDRRVLWHPYAAANSALPLFAVARATGCRLLLADGRELIDGMASWWAAIHGYNHPRLNAAATRQLANMSHVMFGGLTHEPAVRLAMLLTELTGQDRVFFCDSGSVAVEVAMKMAMQYQIARRRQQKNKFVTICGGYHGDTLHAMSVCDPDTGMHQLWRGLLPRYHFAPRPKSRFDSAWLPNDTEALEAILKARHEELCALILEPIVQGAGGMWFYHPEYLRVARDLCRRYDVLFIADEIATGFGRSGKLFACEHAGVKPDILCLGKALTGGYLTLAATLCADEIAATISMGEPGVFMHGPTFMANPLACAVALESVRMLVQSNWQSAVGGIERALAANLKRCASLPTVRDTRALGAIGVVETVAPINMASMTRRLVELGVWLRPFGHLLYTMPPYCISESELRRLCDAMFEVLQPE